MGALPLMLVHVRLDFADLPELRAEAEVHVFSRVLRPMGYMPLTGEHNTDDRSPQPHGSGTGTRAAPAGSTLAHAGKTRAAGNACGGMAPSVEKVRILGLLRTP